MQTEVIMKRTLFDAEVEQKSKTEFFNATDLVKAGNKWRRNNGLPDFNYSAYLNKLETKEFIAEIQNRYGLVQIKESKKSKSWVHPLLFIDIALAISPTLKIEVYEWLYDNLLKFRNDLGDSYKKMTGALFHLTSDKSNFHRYIPKVALQIQSACNVIDWQSATEEQLKLRDRMHENIALLCSVLRNREESVRLGILDAIKP